VNAGLCRTKTSDWTRISLSEPEKIHGCRQKLTKETELNKNQTKIMAVIYKNQNAGITPDDIAKQTRLSKEIVAMELDALEAINAIMPTPGCLYKPGTGKLKMFA